MTPTPPPTRIQASFAYALSAITTLLWVACVIPAGDLADATLLDEWATPMHREALLLVPALLLLTALPVGFTLARREEGLIGVLASTDAFVASYAAIALMARHPIRGIPALVAVLLLFAVAALSFLEAWRAVRASRRRGGAVPRALRGARLALCVLVLMIPPDFLLEEGTELASWMGPFVFVALSAAGVRLARTGRGLRLTAATLQFLIAVHVVLTITYTLKSETPHQIADLRIPGQVAQGLALAVGVVALAQCLVLLGRGRTGAPDPSPAPSAG